MLFVVPVMLAAPVLLDVVFAVLLLVTFAVLLLVAFAVVLTVEFDYVPVALEVALVTLVVF